MRVLLLEKEPSPVTELLEQQGYQVCSAREPERAVQLASEQSFDLVVVDVPREGGHLEALAQMKESFEIPSLLLSETTALNVLGGHLTKPYEPEALLETVRRLISQHRSERELLEREREVRTVTAWALRQLAASYDMLNQTPMVQAAGALAARLARAVGLDSEQVELIELVALATAIHNLAPALGMSLPAMSSVPQSVLTIIECLCENWDGSGPRGWKGEQIPIGARIVKLTMASVVGGPLGGPRPPAQLARGLPGRYDPWLLETLENFPPENSEQELEPAQRRTLLALGKALLGAGETRHARQALEQVSQKAPSREGVESLLALAQLERSESSSRASLERAQEALQMARRVGPESSASAALEAGLMLARMDSPEARQVLEEALVGAEQLHRPGAAAQARLALARWRPEEPSLQASLELLLLPEHEPELASSAPWLLPWVLENPGSLEAAPRVAERLLQSHPDSLQPEGLSARARRNAVQATHNPELLARLVHDPDQQVRELAQQRLKSTRQEPSPPVLRVFSFGPLEVWAGSHRLDEKRWKSRRAKYLFAYLAAHSTRPVQLDQIIEEFWPGDSDKGKKAVYSATYELRKAFQLDAVLRQRELFSLNPELPRWHDLEEFERARQGLESARKRVRLYRGPYLDGCYMDWALARRTRLEQEAVDAMLTLARDSQPAEGLELSRRILEVDPLHQQAHLEIMRAQTALGRPEEALRQFEVCRRRLAAELSIEPNTELLEAYQRARLAIP